VSVAVEAEDDHIVMQAPLVYKDRCREVPGARYDNKTRTWRYPLSWAHCVMLRGVFGDELIVGERLTTWAREERRTRVDPALAIREEAS
jgi:hypothetical protein